ncbi:recombinase family protein [Psychroflexus salis]|uniref:Resolvase n=1 Tax=Psychroflexus salis TaxID=1526574 RepID=A0A916ZQI3_9FLAO|nr:recombinase family protein [Psychroflexus salis]GGE09151.1 resolvase [Psychroflexus salis]
MKVLYVRKSTIEQNTDRQKVNVKDFDYLIEDSISGSVPFFERPGGIKIMKLINDGVIKELNVWSIDRMGRNLKDILLTIEYFNSKQVPVRFINQAILTLNQDGTENSIGKLIISILASVAEMERTQIRERQMQGIELAKARKIYKGRANGTKEDILTFLSKPKNKKAVELLKKGYKNIEVSRIVGIHPNTVTKVKHKMQLDIEK